MSSRSRGVWGRASRAGLTVVASSALAVGLMVAVPSAAQAERTVVQASRIQKAMIMNALMINLNPKCLNVAFAKSDKNWGLLTQVKKLPGCPESEGRTRVIWRAQGAWRVAFWSNDPEGCNLYKMPDNVRHDFKRYVRCANEPLPQE